jgi:hypothetical protein
MASGFGRILCLASLVHEVLKQAMKNEQPEDLQSVTRGRSGWTVNQQSAPITDSEAATANAVIHPKWSPIHGVSEAVNAAPI